MNNLFNFFILFFLFICSYYLLNSLQAKNLHQHNVNFYVMSEFCSKTDVRNVVFTALVASDMLSFAVQQVHELLARLGLVECS